MKTSLLSWYDIKNIQYPWRNQVDPYRVWLSEIMLQQTQVNTVIPYYNKWLLSLPTLKSVARSNLTAILKLWEGLGYYARARNFYKSSKIIHNNYSGKIPNDSRFISLPGVGEYIDAAVRSIAFNHPIPVVDTNVKRVMSRYLQYNISNNLDILHIKNILLEKISNNRPGDFNQALMDLGRLICKPRDPQCFVCPLQNACLSYDNNTVHLFPLKKQKKIKPHYEVVVAIIWSNNKILISKRPHNKMLGGLWEFPGGKIEADETKKDCVKREIKEELDLNINPYKYIQSITHSYTHFSIEMHAYHCTIVSGLPKSIGCEDFKWIEKNEIFSLPFPKANHKIFSQIPITQP